MRLRLSHPLGEYPHFLAYGHTGNNPIITPSNTKIRIPLIAIGHLTPRFTRCPFYFDV
jgi:hypothetical protein